MEEFTQMHCKDGDGETGKYLIYPYAWCVESGVHRNKIGDLIGSARYTEHSPLCI